MFESLDKQNQKRPMKLMVLAAILIAAGVALMTGILANLHGGTKSQNQSHLTLMAFLGVVTVLMLAVPVKFLERQRTDERERVPAGNDPLPELENRGELFDSLEMEIKRSRRSQRSFAFLKIQIDETNRINRQHGHIAGDKAACRLSQVLQANCRELDIVVRYGNDEFAIVLPEAGPETIGRVTRRIHDRLAGNRKLPPIPVHIGAAMFPEEATSIDALLEAADREIYDVKTIANPQTSLCA